MHDKKNSTPKNTAKVQFPERFEAFEQLAASYGVESPEALKLKIIWSNLRALIEHAYGDNNPANTALLRTYDAHWRICEIEEYRFVALIKKNTGLK